MINVNDRSLENIILNALNIYKQKGEMPKDFAPAIIRYFAQLTKHAGLDRRQAMDSAMLIASALLDVAQSFGKKSEQERPDINQNPTDYPPEGWKE